MPRKKTSSVPAIVVKQNGKDLLTPGKHPLALPAQPLADEIAAEWRAQQKFNAQKMPLTLLAYTAIDRIAPQREHIVEVLLAYVDTDTLSYRAESQDVLQEQKIHWDPVLKWASKRFDAIWQTTSGIMPIAQPEALHEALKNYLLKLNAMQLAAVCILASGYSSLVLAIAVLEKYLSAKKAFVLSRVEEEVQIRKWGRDKEAAERAARLEDDLISAERFLRLLDAA